MKKFGLILFIILLSQSAYTQLYTTAVGIRMGTDWGITVQQRIMNKVTVEGILQSSLQREEVLFTGLIEKHHSLFSKGLNVYTGIGLHKGWLQSNQNEIPHKNPFGTTIVMGAELSLGRLNISYDFKPAINFSGGERRFYSQTGVSLRYILLKNKVFKKYQKEQKKKRRAKNKERQWWEVWK